MWQCSFHRAKGNAYEPGSEPGSLPVAESEIPGLPISSLPNQGLLWCCLGMLAMNGLLVQGSRGSLWEPLLPSLYLYPWGRFRLLCHRIITHKMFDHVVLVIIFLNCITIAMERPKIDPHSAVSHKHINTSVEFC